MITYMYVVRNGRDLSGYFYICDSPCTSSSFLSVDGRGRNRMPRRTIHVEITFDRLENPEERFEFQKEKVK